MNIQTMLFAAAGGALATVVRYVVTVLSARFFGSGFPYGTMIINVSGSFLIGLLIGLFASRWNVTEPVRAFLIIGICGGYTTFSTFSLDIWYFMERGDHFHAAVYIIGSVALSLLGLIAAISLTRVIGPA